MRVPITTRKLLLLAVVCSVLFFPINAQEVELDPNFGTNGFFLHQLDSDGAWLEDVAIKNTGSIVLGGWTFGPAFWDKFAVVQLTPSGILDTGFNSTGMSIIAVSNFNRGDALFVQDDGKTILGGRRYFGSTDYDFTLLKYNTNGTLDTGFDSDGVRTYNVNLQSIDEFYDMRLDSSGKLLLVGSTQADQAQQSNMAITRVGLDGQFDSTFVGGGILTLSFQNAPSSANSVDVQSDGKIIVGGRFHNGNDNDFVVLRLTSAGSLDLSFGTAGFTIGPFGSDDSSITKLHVLSDDKILAGGSQRVVRYLSTGQVDTGFGSAGTVNVGHSVRDIEILKSGKFYVIGGSGGEAKLTRYNANGTKDTTFNSTGTASFTAPGHTCSGRALEIQNDGKFVAGANCFGGNIDKFGAFRLREIVAPTGNAPFDFDGDSKTDVSIFRPGPGEWWYLRSSDGGNFAAQFGAGTDTIAPADFTGDGKTDIAFFRPTSGEWFVLRSEDNSFFSFPFGTNGDIPVPGDYDGDGMADPAVFRPSSSTWFILNSGGGTHIETFGTTGDQPVPADYDGDGKDDIGIYRPSLSEWWINRSQDGLMALQFGASGDQTTPGDFTGDGKDDIAFFRPSNGFWFVLRSEDQSFFSFPFGTTGDIPAPGDYDGDGVADATVFRPSNNTWFKNQSTDGFEAETFGITNDIPVPNAYVTE